MARMKLGRDFDWMDYRTWESFEDGKAWLHVTATPKRLFALRPSFWLFAIRYMRLRPFRSEVVETEE